MWHFCSLSHVTSQFFTCDQYSWSQVCFLYESTWLFWSVCLNQPREFKITVHPIRSGTFTSRRGFSSGPVHLIWKALCKGLANLESNQQPLEVGGVSGMLDSHLPCCHDNTAHFWELSGCSSLLRGECVFTLSHTHTRTGVSVMGRWLVHLKLPNEAWWEMCAIQPWDRRHVYWWAEKPWRTYERTRWRSYLKVVLLDRLNDGRPMWMWIGSVLTQVVSALWNQPHRVGWL